MIPMKEVLTYFLELPNVFNIIMNYIKKIESCNCICSILQSKRWKDIKKSHPNKIMLPFTLYGDDFEINKALGSHRQINKMHSLYFLLSCIPREYSSMFFFFFFFFLRKICES